MRKKPGIISRTLIRMAHAVGGSRAAGWTQSILGSGKAGYDVNNASRRILNNRPGDRTAADLSLSELPALRSYARQLERNNPTARAACDGTAAIVVGSGISLEIDQPEWSEQQKELVRKEWLDWCDSATVDGRSVYELEEQGWREVFTAGELVWRLVIDRDRVKRGEIPLAVLPLESEWLDNSTGALMQVLPDKTVKVGPICLDVYGRPMSYDIRNPETIGSFQAETVRAADIIHVFERRRSMQTRGESWLAPVVETLNQERDLVTTELQSAKTGASIGLAITSEMHAELDTTEDGETDDPAQALRIGGVARLFPGDQLQSFQTTRPSQQIMPFRNGLRGDTAAALRVPQRFLDRDISRVGSYSAMRGDNQDEERLMGPVREWYGQATIGRLYREVLPLICAKVGVPMPRKIKYKLLPDGQPYVDPEKDIAAAQAAINAGLSTKEQEVGKRGGDWRAMAKQKETEDLQTALGAIDKIAQIQKACDASGVPGLTWSHIMTLSGAGSAPGAYLTASIAAPAAETVAGDPTPEKPQPDPGQARWSGFVDGMRAAKDMAVPAQQPSININPVIHAHSSPVEVRNAIPEQPAPVVNVKTAAPVIRVEVPEQPAQPAPVVNVNVEAQPAPVVNVAAPNVTVENEVIVPQRKVIAKPGLNGEVIMTPVEG